MIWGFFEYTAPATPQQNRAAEIAFVTSTMSDPDEPQSFQEVWWDPDLVAREKWQDAICLEFKKMLDMHVWRHVNRQDHPQEQRLVGHR